RASPVRGVSGGGGAFETRSRMRKPARPSTRTSAITIATGGMDSLGAVALTALSAANGHLSNLDCRRSHPAAKLQIATYRLDCLQHLHQIPGDGHLAHRESRLA